MVAIFTGSKLGLEQSSLQLGAAGVLGTALQGRGGDKVFVNAASGNLVISRSDEFLVGIGPDLDIARTYNSLGDLSDDNRDNWRLSTQRKLTGLPVVPGAIGGFMTRVTEDGSLIRHVYSEASAKYETTDGEGTHDAIRREAGFWRWTDGATGRYEDYDDAGKLTRVTSIDGGYVNYSYVAGTSKIDKVSTSDGSEVRHIWSGDNLAELRTSYTALSTGVRHHYSRVRYSYDASNRLTEVRTDLSPDDDSIADGRVYVTNYAYHGTSKLVSTITQTDGSNLAIGYDAAGRVISLAQTAASGDVRTTTLSYGRDNTEITDPAGQVTRLDYSGGSVVPELSGWGVSNLSTLADTIGGQRATRYTQVTAGQASAIATGFSMKAGETATFAITLQAGAGSTTTQTLGIYSNSFGWRDLNITSARVVSGPGTVVASTGSLWRVDNLSATAGTRIEISHTATADGTFGAYLYNDMVGGYRSGQAVLAADAQVTVSSESTQLASLDLNNWVVAGVTKQPAAAIHGGPAYRLTAQNVGASLGREFVVKAQDMISWSVSLQAVGTATSQQFGLYGYSSDWGVNNASMARIVSGPGTLQQAVGGIWVVHGLSASTPTRIEMIRTFDRNETTSAFLYVDAPGGYRTSASMIASASRITRISAETSPNYRLSKITAPPATTGQAAQVIQFGYDRDNNLTSVTDALGRVTVYQFDANGNNTLVTDPNGHTAQRTYDASNNLVMERIEGSSASGGNEALYTRYVHDSERHLRYVVSAQGEVTEYRYSAEGHRTGVVRYPGYSFAIGSNLLSESEMVAWHNSLPDRSTTSLTSLINDARGNLLLTHEYATATAAGFASADDGYESTRYIYDQAGRLLKRHTEVWSGQLSVNPELFAYDGMGRLVSSTQSDGGTTTITFDDAATKTTLTSARGALTVQTFNKAGDLLSTVESGHFDLVPVATSQYDRLGRARVQIDPAGRKNYSVYDKAGRLTATVSDDGQFVEYRYDGANRLVATARFITLSSGHFSALGDPNNALTVDMLRPAHHEADIWNWTVYDVEGRVIGEIDGSGSMIGYEYDRADRLIKTTNYQNKLDAATRTAFKSAPPTDLNGFSGPNTVSRIFYDRDGRRIGNLNAEGYLSETVYDSAGRVVQEILYRSLTSFGERASGSFTRLRAGVDPQSPDHNRIRHVYNAQDKLRFSIDAQGYVSEYIYFHDGQGDTSVLGPRKTIRYAAPISNLATFTVASVKAAVAAQAGSASNRVERSVYASNGRLAYAIDATGGVTRFDHDLDGNVVKSTRYATLLADSSMRTQQTMNDWAAANGADARITRNYYAARGFLRYVVDAEGFVRQTDYYPDDRVAAVYRWDNRIAIGDTNTIDQIHSATLGAGGYSRLEYYTYDRSGRLEWSYDAFDIGTLHNYHATGTKSRVWRAQNDGGIDDAASFTNHDAAGRLAQEYAGFGSPDQTLTRYEHDGYGNLIRTTDARNRVTSYSYDKLGQVLTATDAENGLTRFSYDAFGNMASKVDPKGNASYNYYDSFGRVIISRDAENHVTQTSYNEFGEVASVTRRYNRATNAASTTALPLVAHHAQDAVTRFYYDANGRLVRSSDANGQDEHYAYNAFGDRTLVTNRLGGNTTFVSDRRGQLLSKRVQRDDNGNANSWTTTEFSYDARGNRTQMIEAAGAAEARTTNYQYDRKNQLISTQRPPILVFDPVTTGEVLTTPVESFRYDNRGNMTEARDPAGARTLYFYDDLDRVAVQIDALGGYTRFTYDPNGNLISRRAHVNGVALPGDGGAFAEAPGAPAGEYRETTFAYDGLNRMTRSTIVGARWGAWNGSAYAGGFGDLVTEYVHDAMGNVVKLIDANGAATWSYYDRLGRKTHQVDARNYRTSWQYDAEGNVLGERRYANLVATPVGTVTVSGVTPDDGNDRETLFGYDKLGNRRFETRMRVLVHDDAGAHVLANPTIEYRYNGLNQVTSRHEANGDVVAYEYDKSGRLEVERRPGFTGFHGAPVQPVVEYDYNGLDNLIATRQLGDAYTPTRTTNYHYGPGGQLTGMTDAANTYFGYMYDVAGRRVRSYYDRATPAGNVHHSDFVSYDLLGRVTQQWAGTPIGGGAWRYGDRTRLRYTAQGEIAEVGINDLWGQRNVYNSAGRLEASNMGDGVWKLFGYDKAGNQTALLTSAGQDLAGLTIEGGLTTVGWASVNATYTQFDAGGQAVAVIEEGRQIDGTGTLHQLVTSYGRNAFGDVINEWDALGHNTTHWYNTMGRRVRSESPLVSITLETGATQSIRPTDHAYYDRSGRLTGARDANGRLTRLSLLAGSGHGGGEALVTQQINADGGVRTNGYDIFADLRRATDEIGRSKTMAYDGAGRLIVLAHHHGLVEGFRHDGAGRRIRHWTSAAVGDEATTTYDLDGRVIATRAIGGEVTTTAWQWNAGASFNGLHGGWQKSVTHASGLWSLVTLDQFGREHWKRDLGGVVTTTGYDVAGRATGQTIHNGPGGWRSYSYLNSGQLSGITDSAGMTAAYGYDKMGRRAFEHLVKGGAVHKNASARYDALGRMTWWAEAGGGAVTGANVAIAYDPVGNIRRQVAHYHDRDAQGIPIHAVSVRDHWFAHDAMNRVVVDKGVLSAGRVVRGAFGSDYSYNAAGERRTQTRDAWLTGYRPVWVWYPGHDPNLSHYPEPIQPGFNGEYQDQPFSYPGERRETYHYDAGGRIASVSVEETGHDPETGQSTGQFDAAWTQAVFAHDALGRQTSQTDFHREGGAASYHATTQYDARGRTIAETADTRRGNDIFRTVQTFTHGDPLAGPTRVDAVTSKNGDGAAVPDHSTTTSYTWRDGALANLVTHRPDTAGSTTHTTTHVHDAFGVLASAQITDGRQRTVSFTTDELGQVIRRAEADTLAGGDPHELWYRFGGKQMGYTGNNGTQDTGWHESVAARAAAPGAGAFRGGSSGSTPHTDFAQSLDPLNSFQQGAAAGGYTARAGETLAGIAAQLWGDASLWWKLADANPGSGSGASGLSGPSTGSGLALGEGQRLRLPAGVAKNTHNAATFAPYDPGEAIGDLNPTTPTPARPKKANNKCGAFGAVLLAVVAVAVVIATRGAATNFAAGLLGANTAGATAATVAAANAGGAILGGALAGAAGSIASQGVGLATGIQDRFSFRGVAMAALGGGVGAGLGGGAMLGSEFAGDAARGALGSALTQGIGVAAGLQGKFDWAGVAAAGIGGAAGGAFGREVLGIDPSALGNSAADHARQFAMSSADAIAQAATRGALQGTSFGDNLAASIPSVIGNTLGRIAGGAIAEKLAQVGADPKRKTAVDATEGEYAAEMQAAFAQAGIQTERTADGIRYSDFAGKSGSVAIDGRRFFYGQDGTFVADGNGNAVIRTGAGSPDGVVRGSDGGDIHLRFGGSGTTSVSSMWFGYEGDSGAVRLMLDQDGIGELYSGGEQTLTALGLNVSYGERAELANGFKSEGSLHQAALNMAFASSRHAPSSGLTAGGVLNTTAELTIPGYWATRQGSAAVQSGNYWLAAGYYGMAAGEVGLTVGTFGASNAIATGLRGGARLGIFGAQRTAVAGFAAETIAPKVVHKNSLSYVGDTHVYVIKGPDGSLYKVGESAQGVRVGDGASIRAEQQARALQRETGEFYTTEIRQNFAGKADARAYETRFIQTYERLYGKRPPGNPSNR